jgi:hypothetical protein
MGNGMVFERSFSKFNSKESWMSFWEWISGGMKKIKTIDRKNRLNIFFENIK